MALELTDKSVKSALSYGGLDKLKSQKLQCYCSDKQYSNWSV